MFYSKEIATMKSEICTLTAELNETRALLTKTSQLLEKGNSVRDSLLMRAIGAGAFSVTNVIH